MRKLNRRTFLRGMLGGAAVAVGLPALEIFLNGNGTAYASGAPLPRRFGIFFWGNGTLPAKWVPSGTGFGDAWALSDQLTPLASLKHLVTVVTGCEVNVVNSDPHASGAAGILSGSSLSQQGTHRTFTSPSVDQLVAQAIGEETRFRSLEFGAFPGPGYSYNGPNNMNPPESSPKAFFDRLFGGGFGGAGGRSVLGPAMAMRKSVLDAVAGDVLALQKRLGASDRLRVEQHLTGIRELERRITLSMEQPAAAACEVPSAPPASFPDREGRPQIAEKNRAMVDTLVMALACDQTRVFSNYFTASLNNMLFPEAPAGHHQLTHDEPGEQPEVNKIVKQIIAEFGYLISALQAIPEGDGTLLDNCVVLGTTDCSEGRTHALHEFPILLAGSAGKRLKQGYHLRSGAQTNASSVILTLMQAVGVPATSFGTGTGKSTEAFDALWA